MMAQWQCKSTHPHCKALLSQGDFPQIIELILLFVVFYTCWLQKHAYTWLIYMSLCIWIATVMMVCLEMVRQEYLKRHAKFYDLVSWELPAYTWWSPGQCSPLQNLEFGVGAVLCFYLTCWSLRKYQSWFLLQVDMDLVVCSQIHVNRLRCLSLAVTANIVFVQNCKWEEQAVQTNCLLSCSFSCVRC